MKGDGSDGATLGAMVPFFVLERLIGAMPKHSFARGQVVWDQVRDLFTMSGLEPRAGAAKHTAGIE